MRGILRILLGFFLLVGCLLIVFSPMLMGLVVGLSLGGWHIPIWAGIGFIAMALVYGKN